MKFRNYVFIFLVVIICFVISITQYSPVLASQVVFDEIEQFVSPTDEINFPTEQINSPLEEFNSSEEEKQIDEPIHQDISEPNSTDTEEQPADNDKKPPVEEEQPSEDEDTITNTTIKEKQIIPAKKTITEPKEKDLSVPKTNESISVETVAEEKSVSEEESKLEEKSKINYLSLSEFFNKCANFFSDLWFNKIIVLKEAVINHFPSKQSSCNLCCRPIIQHITTPKDFVPYYFLYSQNFLEKTVFAEKITNPKDLLPLSCTVSNYIIKKIDMPKNAVTPQGTSDIRVLLNAPSPEIKVVGKSLYAKIVVDIRNNTLYKYDEDGFPLKAYLVATGAKGNRTKTGLRIVTYKEKFPYKGAPVSTKRIVDPYSYGPYIIFLNRVNPKTGRQTNVDQFLHGNGNEKSIMKS